MGDYWGSVTIGYNANLVKNPPKSFADLLKPEYKNQVALNGSPLTSGSAIAGVFAAALSNGGSLSNVAPGVDWFAKCKSVGNFIPVQTVPQTVASGQTPISIDWDYNNFAYVKEFPSANWKVTIPSDGQYGGHYAQAVNATAPHPFAARLWEEFIYSDQGQILYLKGYAHPGALRRPGRAEGDPEGADGIASGRVAQRHCEVREPGSAGGREGASSTPSGRQRSARAEPLATEAVTQDALRPGPAPGRRRPSLAWLGVVPFFAYATLFLVLPALTVMIGAFRSEGGGYTIDNVRSIVQSSNLRDAFVGEHPDQPHDGAPRRAVRAPDRLRGDPQGDAGLDPLGVRDVLRRRGELRRHPARLRVHRHARARSGS